MRCVSLDEAGKAWDEFFAKAKKSVFKCEVLQDYTAVDMGPSLQAWYDGDKELSVKLMIEADRTNEWMKAYLARDIRKTRVHIVQQPYSPYLEWEIECYKRGHKGEDIFLASSEELGSIKIPNGDYWIFDDSSVVEYAYVGLHGNPVGGYIYPPGSDIARFRLARDEALKHGELVART